MLVLAASGPSGLSGEAPSRGNTAGVEGGLPGMATAVRQRQVHLYTFSDTLPHPGLCMLAEAAVELGGLLRVLGLSKRPGYILIHSHSPTLKFLMLQDVVEYEMSVGRVAADDLMIFVDGHDVLLQRPLSDIVRAYDRWPDSPYLISGEKNCWPWPHTDPSHGHWDPGMAVPANLTWPVGRWLRLAASDFCRVVERRGPYPYPNIGASMGPVSRVLEVLRRNNRIVLEEDVNDQGAMWLVILRHADELRIEIDQRSEVFLSMLQYEPGELSREPCVDGWFERIAGRPGLPPVPPRNLLTNTTPALVHFNGPSHEDGVWPSCYQVFSHEFSTTGRRHAFFDIDHNMLVGTDNLCDYSWTKIRDFHAHPLNGEVLNFLESFYRLPVDPGLLARRGAASTLDATRLGREEDLHAGAGRLRQVLGAGAAVRS